MARFSFLASLSLSLPNEASAPPLIPMPREQFRFLVTDSTLGCSFLLVLPSLRKRIMKITMIPTAHWWGLVCPFPCHTLTLAFLFSAIVASLVPFKLWSWRCPHDWIANVATRCCSIANIRRTKVLKNQRTKINWTVAQELISAGDSCFSSIEMSCAGSQLAIHYRLLFSIYLLHETTSTTKI